MPELPLVGDEFAGYRLRSVLGRGGMSVVFQAEHPRLGNVVAIKVLAPDLASDDIFRTRFLEESRIAASMNHPNVIPIHDMGASDGLLYIVMRYVSGTDLRQMIKKRGRLQPETAVFLLSQAARALDAAHAKGLVHRDVKPGNLLVERSNDDEDPDHLYLADFGITKRVMTHTGLTSTGQFIGTVDYVAPEQIRGPSVAGMADQYSLGCVLYECLTGRVPFEKDMMPAIIWAHVEEQPTQPTLLRPDLPPAVDRVFARVLAKQPGDRYRNCREFMDAARTALGDRAAPPPPGPRPPQPAPGGYTPTVAGPGATVADYPAQPPAAAPSGYAGAPPADYPAGAPAAMIGYPGELTHEKAGSPNADTEAMFIGNPPGPPRDNTIASHRRPPAEAPPGGGDPGGGEPPGGSGPRRGDMFRSRWVVVAAVVLLALAAGGGAYAALSGGTAKQQAAGSTHPPTSAKSTSGATAAAAAAAAAKPGTLMTTLTAADHSSVAIGKLPPQTCTQESAELVNCTQPWPTLSQATFTTYPTLTTLYAAYQAKVESLSHTSAPLHQNTKADCGAATPPSPYGERGWNHDELHPTAYSIAQMEAGQVPFEKAAGRMACIPTAGGSEDIVWTTDIGNMLGVAIGSGTAVDVWNWWVPVHHWILFPGTPSMASMNSCSGLMRQATGCSMTGSSMPSSSMSASASMGSSTMPSSSKSPSMSP
jgi:protein kinase-like protein